MKYFGSKYRSEILEGPMTSNMRIIRNIGSAFAFAGLAVLLIVTATGAQTNTGMTLTATAVGVGSASVPIKVSLVQWSTDAERNALVASMSPPPRGAGRGRGAAPDSTDPFGTFGRAAGAPVDPAIDPAAPPPPTAARGARAGGGAAAVGPPPFDAMASLSAAIAKATTVGYLWTDEVSGYSIKYAFRMPLPGGGERIVLATARRIGAVAPASSTGPDFTIVEFRVDAKGLGEGKTSLNTKAIVDVEAKTLAVENYAAAPAVFKNVKK